MFSFRQIKMFKELKSHVLQFSYFSVFFCLVLLTIVICNTYRTFSEKVFVVINVHLQYKKTIVQNCFLAAFSVIFIVVCFFLFGCFVSKSRKTIHTQYLSKNHLCMILYYLLFIFLQEYSASSFISLLLSIHFTFWNFFHYYLQKGNTFKSQRENENNRHWKHWIDMIQRNKKIEKVYFYVSNGHTMLYYSGFGKIYTYKLLIFSWMRFIVNGLSYII